MNTKFQYILAGGVIILCAMFIYRTIYAMVCENSVGDKAFRKENW